MYYGGMGMIYLWILYRQGFHSILGATHRGKNGTLGDWATSCGLCVVPGRGVNHNLATTVVPENPTLVCLGTREHPCGFDAARRFFETGASLGGVSSICTSNAYLVFLRGTFVWFST